ncbi:MAG: hypothetical protein CTY19_04860 [Methylomonas sp.]|nr:MAG: hypothetical protein CTY19_04860 [Methylomonas sp.]
MTLNLSYKSIAWFVLIMTALGVVVGLAGPRIGHLITGSLALIASVAFRINALKEASREREEQEKQIRKAESQQEFTERIHLQAQEKTQMVELRPNQNRLHIRETSDGFSEVDWRDQLEEVKTAWEAGDFEFARTWLQKLAYRLSTEQAPQSVHDEFKALMTAFTREDPLYADVMKSVLPVIAENPYVIQSELSKQFPEFDPEQFRYAMYYAEQIGDVLRTKKGRSSALSIPEPKAEKTKQTQKSFELLMAFIAATLNKMPDEWGKARELSGMDAINVLWPLNDIFRPHMPEIVALPYDKTLETEADLAIEAFIGGEGESAWERLSLGVWRVLVERHTQALVVARTNEAAGNSVMTIPEDLPEHAWLCATMLYLMYQMELPYPVKPLSLTGFPAVGVPAPLAI